MVMEQEYLLESKKTAVFLNKLPMFGLEFAYQ
jgi:hypothetical protein